MVKMDEGTYMGEGEEKACGGNEKAEDKFEGTISRKAKKQQRIKKRTMPAVACKKKLVYASQNSKKEKMKMMQNKTKIEITKKQQKKKKDMATADASRREILIGEENMEEQKEEQVENVLKIETTTKEISEKKRERGKKRKNETPGDSDKVVADDEKPKKDELANDKNMKPNALNKAEKKGKRMKPNTVPEDSDDQALRNADKPEASTAGKASKEVKGLIFMCNSKTKQDCYHYNVLGLPANKKNIVAKVYEGMRLFLFDVDLKLLYGIYVASGSGGYDIEPKAFKSAFPAQVRFHVSHDCLPLAEEKFKAAIKNNYYSKKKFNCQLTSEQVKALCKLFRATTKKSQKRKQSSTERVTEQDYPINEEWNRKRSRVQARKRGYSSKGKRDGSRNKGRHRSSPFDGHTVRSHVLSGARMARGPLLDGDLFYLGHHGMYERDAYISNASPLPLSPLSLPYTTPILPQSNPLPRSAYASTALPPLPSHASTLQPSLAPPSYASTVAHPPAPSYGYQQASNMDYYRRDFLSELHNQPRDPLLELHDRQLLYQEPLPRTDVEYPDLRPRAVEYDNPYSMYTDPALLHEPLFPSSVPSRYNPSLYRC